MGQFTMDYRHEKKPEAKKQHDRMHTAIHMENETPINESLDINREGYMNEMEATQSNNKRNTEVTAKAPLASAQLNYMAQQDKS